MVGVEKTMPTFLRGVRGKTIVVWLSWGSICLSFSEQVRAQSHSVPHDDQPEDEPQEDQPKDEPQEESAPSKKQRSPPRKDPREGKKLLDPGPREVRSSPSTSARDKRRGSTSSSTTKTRERGRASTASSTSPSAHSQAGHSQASGESNTNLGGRALLTVGGHVTYAGPELQKTSDALGGGVNALLAWGPESLPIFFGAQLGYDAFETTTERFMYDGEIASWDLHRSAFWAHGLVRWMPRSGVVRPHVDLLAGVWTHDVQITPGGVTNFEETSRIGGGYTGSYGFGAGMHFVSPSGFLAGLSIVHLRGGSITVPDLRNTAVVDDLLYYGDVTTRGIHQWVFMLEIGWVTR